MWSSFEKSFEKQVWSVSYLILIVFTAFMCHHNVFLLYDSIENADKKKWDRVTLFSVTVSSMILCLFGIAGYVTFTGYTQGKNLSTKMSIYIHINLGTLWSPLVSHRYKKALLFKWWWGWRNRFPPIFSKYEAILFYSYIILPQSIEIRYKMYTRVLSKIAKHWIFE